MSEIGYIDSYVAFIDILGFKEFIMNNEFENAYKLFSKIKESQDAALSCFNSPKANSIRNDGKPYNMTINVISDSIVISIPKTSPNSLYCLLAVSSIFAFEILKDYNLLCRGAIAEGNFYADTTIAYGPALVKAYIMESKLAVYPRIIFTNNTFESYLNNHLITDDVDDFSRNLLMNLDIKDDLFYVDYLKCGMYLNIDDAHENPTYSNEAYSDFDSIRKNIENRISNETDPHIREKYLYLKNYYNQTISSLPNLLPYPIPFKCDLVFEKNDFKNIQYTNKSNTQNNNNINQQYIGGNATATIANETKKSADSISEKFMEIFNDLPFEEQLAIMNIAVEKSKNHKEEMI